MASSRNWVYDVFPSFHGEDVRKTFLSHLLKELDRKMIIAFRDNEIEKGKTINPELKKTINDSKIAVVVISEGYASSSWCLDELVEILECKEEFDQKVIPIFYNLDPSHVRKQIGNFGDAFEMTCQKAQNRTEEVKDRWRKALTEVANYSGYDSRSWHNEAEMIEEIANNILEKLSLTPSKDFEDFVGLEDHIAEINLLMEMESKEVVMIGIWGSPGIGKTTIARALFSRLSPNFQKSVFIDRNFISNSKEKYCNSGNLDEYNMKLHLQEKILSEILDKKDMRVHHLGAMGERLKDHKVLIVLDDLDDQVVLDALAGRSQWFGSGSRIIVITKDKRILKAHNIQHIHEVCLPSKKFALEMLCQFAFKQNSPPDGFTELTSKLVEQAGCLPLGLNVLGSYFRGTDKEDWMDMFSRIRSRLDEKIEKTLKVSYKGLNNKNDQALFRHIACLFNGEKENDIKQLLAYSDLEVNIGLKNLVDKSLIHVRWDCVEMHYLLQETGKQIVRTQPNEPGEREFLVDSKDICDILKYKTGPEKILGISLDVTEIEELCVHVKAFRRMFTLRYLKVYTKPRKSGAKLHLPDDFDYLPSTLRLLCWDGYPVKCLPSKFCPKNLVKIKLRESQLEKLWEGVQSLACLKDLDLRGSKNLKELPDLSKATNLEKMDLSYCSSLVELPSSVRFLKKLINLSMATRTDLETLSSSINPASSSMLSGCSLLNSFSDISSNMSEPLVAQTEVPWWMENLSMLNHLGVRNTLKYISSYNGELKHLEKCNLPMYGPLSNGAYWHDNTSPSCSLYSPRVQFINFNRKSSFKVIILSGEELPLYRTPRATYESSLEFSPLNNSISQQFSRFRTYLALKAGSSSYQSHHIRIMVFYCLGGMHNHFHHSANRRDVIFETPLMYKHMVILDYRNPQNRDNDPLADVNYDQVYIRFHIRRESFQLKGCNERSYSCQSPSNQSVLAQVCKVDERNMVNDGCHENDEWRENGVETGRKGKRMKVTNTFFGKKVTNTWEANHPPVLYTYKKRNKPKDKAC